MVSISHWGMFDARDIPYRLWPIDWANDVDTEAFAEFRFGTEYHRLNSGKQD